MKISSNEFQQIQIRFDMKFQKACSIELIPDKNSNFEYFPQRKYINAKGHAYLVGIDENNCFCKFKVNISKIKWVYLWIVDDEIIYLGETVNLYNRFNAGYGNISPRNCFKGGQSTNVKMNIVALKIISAGMDIDIYVFETQYHKKLEKELLRLIKTPYNIKTN